MNKVELVGRLTRDPEVRYTENSSIASINVACDRRFKQDNQPTADFISCKAFGKTAEFIEKYFNKGMKIGLTGHIQTGSYKNSEGNMVYTTDVIIEEVEFVESKNSGSSNSNTSNKGNNAGFMDMPDGIDEELPFN